MADQSYWQGGQPGGHGQFPLQMPPPPPVNQCQGGMPPLLVQPVAPVRKGRRPIGVLAMIVVAALVVVGGGAYAITRVPLSVGRLTRTPMTWLRVLRPLLKRTR